MDEQQKTDRIEQLTKHIRSFKETLVSSRQNSKQCIIKIEEAEAEMLILVHGQLPLSERLTILINKYDYRSFTKLVNNEVHTMISPEIATILNRQLFNYFSETIPSTNVLLAISLIDRWIEFGSTIIDKPHFTDFFVYLSGLTHKACFDSVYQTYFKAHQDIETARQYNSTVYEKKGLTPQLIQKIIDNEKD